jgi:hypothetical protein
MFIQETSNKCMERLDVLIPEVIPKLCPSPDTPGRSLEINQDVLDDEVEKEIDCEHARAFFLIHDTGDKEKVKLQQRLLAVYDFKLKKVVPKHVAARKCAGLNLAGVVVRGRPVHSHAAERGVNTSIQTDV